MRNFMKIVESIQEPDTNDIKARVAAALEKVDVAYSSKRQHVFMVQYDEVAQGVVAAFREQAKKYPKFVILDGDRQSRVTEKIWSQQVLKYEDHDRVLVIVAQLGTQTYETVLSLNYFTVIDL